MYILRYNNLNLDYGGRRVCLDDSGPDVPQDMHFIYLANDYNGDNIPNLAANSTLGSFNRYESGTLTKTGSGSNCYITNGSGNAANHLYVSMSNDDLDLMKAVNNTYCYFFRFVCTSSNTGGILSWRNPSYGVSYPDGYVYMFRCSGASIQFHTSYGINTGLSLTTDTVYKATVNGNSANIVDLNDNTKSWTYSGGSFSRTMNPKMTTFWAGYGSEYVPNGQFYGAAGIARATTAEEDSIIKDILMNQSI
jgi:hypothetical protein